ncbi:ABC transporter permease subunit [Marinilactibacillus sp. XAAS-LB27]|uniref:ABC transporter permease n=1 Tax=Marinilactibacillus sp. XAAS-LB27 TaxID=3114538 RepID=UPI002E175DFD|nr:ABC transporter permease subunit [Marinilactibacillus sp. XAAS-LB27]
MEDSSIDRKYDRTVKNNPSYLDRVKKDFHHNKIKYLMALPVIIFFLVFAYRPMYGLLMVFQNFSPRLGIEGSEWVGLYHFQRFFNDPNAFRIIRNTFNISIWSLLFGFPAPIILALLINEIKNKYVKRIVQTVSYMPYFVSIVVVCSLIIFFTQSNGLIPSIMDFFGLQRQNILANPRYFVPIYVISGIWQTVGWDSIIYLAALSGIDQEQYEAAKIDGANKFQQMWNITIPGLKPTIIILLILRMGSLLSVGFEKILLLYSPSTFSVADVISTYVYRMGLLNADYSYAAAIGLLNTLVNLTLLLITNHISKKVAGSGLF